MRTVRENVAVAWQALRGNWLRSGLTTLGIIIGVGSVVLLVGIGQGVKRDVAHQVESLGTNVVVVLPGRLDRFGRPNLMATVGVSTLTDRDVRDLAAIRGIHEAVPVMFMFGSVEHDGISYSAIVIAATSGIFGLRDMKMSDGRPYVASEENERVCVLGTDPKEQIFGAARAVGGQIVVRSVPYRVVGVSAPEAESVFQQFSFSNVIYLPLASARSVYHAGQINRILLALDYARPPDQTIAEVRRVLLRNHGGREDFGVLTQQQLLGIAYTLFNMVTALLVGISAISLVVAGIGIMNIMLVTVTERTREIGIRKTVGARRRDVFAQFLTEAMMLSFVGGLIGTAIAIGICRVVAAHSPLRPVVTVSTVAMAFGVCFAVGVIFGVAPAIRAARQNPIDALRYE